MYSKSSLGTTVLALVALHSLSLVGVPSSATSATSDGQEQPVDPNGRLEFEELLSRLEMFAAGQTTGADGATVEEPDWLGKLDSLQYGKAGCSETSVGRAQTLLAQLKSEPYDDRIRLAITRQLAVCTDTLAEQIENEMGRLSESTLKLYRSFAEQDQDGNFPSTQNATIAKLRRLASSPNESNDDVSQSELGKAYVRACQEAVDHYTWTFRISPEVDSFYPRPEARHYFRFIRFCRKLVSLDPGRAVLEGLDFSSSLEKALKEFAVPAKFPYYGMHGYQWATYTRACNELIIVFARALSNSTGCFRNKIMCKIIENWEPAKQRCSDALELADNFLWMHKHDLLGLSETKKLKPSAVENLKFLEACEELANPEHDKTVKKCRLMRNVVLGLKVPFKAVGGLLGDCCACLNCASASQGTMYRSAVAASI
jgi:hypothetical protein